MKRILILTYTFPPSPSIGGRRWAKFAKYFDKAGYDVHVLASDLGNGQKSPWSKDIKSLVDKGKVEYLENGYPKILDDYPEGLVNKLKYRMALRKVKNDIRGNFYDRSSYWMNTLFDRMDAKIDEGYETVIATGAPFQYLYYLSDLVKKYPGVKFFADIRDPWANNKTAYGFDSLSEKRQQEVINFEQQVMSKFHHVVTVYDAITKYFKNRSLGKTRFHTIANGYDLEDFQDKAYPDKKDSETIRFVLTGSLYDPALHIFQSFIKSLKELKKDHTEVFNKLRFDFYGRENASYAKYFEDHDLNEVLTHHGLVTIDEVYSNINESDICLLFLTDDMNYSKSTKYYEYVAQRRKIAVFSTPGETGQEVEEERIGYAMTPGEMTKKFLQIVEDHQQGKLSFPESFDPSKFEVSQLLKEYIEIIER